MLKKGRSWLAYHMQAAVVSLRSLGRKPWATLMTVLVIAITLTLPALFWLFVDHAAQITTNWQRGGHISLYLKPTLSSVEQAALLVRVRGTAGVGAATLRSPEEGLVELQQQEGMQDVMRYLPENPLPAVIDVMPAFHVDAPGKLQQLYLLLKSYPQVEQAKLDMQWVSRLNAALDFVNKLAHGLMLLLALAVILIIGNTLRLAIHHRYEEIQVLKLVGAADAYIVRPFLYAGIWYGLAGALLAVLLVNLFMLSLTLAANQLAVAYQMHYPLIRFSLNHVLLLTLSAMVLGWLGAYLSVKRQLALIEPYH